jgi:hypothetical protein
MSAVPLTNPEQHGDVLTGKLERTELQEFRAPVGAQWTFLSDPGRTIQKGLDIAEYNDPATTR